MLPQVLSNLASLPLPATGVNCNAPDNTGLTGVVAAALGALGLFLVGAAEGGALSEVKEESPMDEGVVTL